MVLAAKGYPGPYGKGAPILGLEGVTGAKVFHAGTALGADGQVVRAWGVARSRRGAAVRPPTPATHPTHPTPCPPPKQSQVSAGGRVLGVTATGRDVAEAQRAAYAAVDQIDFADGFCRRDIGYRAVQRLLQQQQQQQQQARP